MDYYRSIIARAIRFIEANLKEDIRVDDIARASTYSRFHFTRIFTELTGETPGAYLRKRRLEEAGSEILAGRDILEVALDYHFGSQEAFTRSFKTYLQATPGTYKKSGLDLRFSMPDKLKEALVSKKLENLRWSNRWTSHLGCIKGCLNYLSLDVSDAWLFGATGHAFIINIAGADV
jgi:AraC family transcriptional regulator